MRATPQPWNPYTLKQHRARINPQPQYQRTEVWSEAKKQRLIDTILRGYDIPKFYLAPSSVPEFRFEVVDGQQRIRAIWEFMDGGFTTSDEFTPPLKEWGDIAGKYWTELPMEAQDQIGLFPLSVVMLEDCTDQDLRDLFLRLQEGVSASPAEKRNAIGGNMCEFVAELANKHNVFRHTLLESRRFGWHDITAHVVCLELAEGPTNIKATDLQRMYDNNKDFNTKGEPAKRVKKVLNFMEKALDPEVPEMNIKWGFVDLYLLISLMMDEYVLFNREEDFAAFYIDFEQTRRAAILFEDYKVLAASDSLWDRRMFDYLEAFNRDGGKRANINIRNSVYTEWALDYLSKKKKDLVPKGSRRLFNENERIVIWRKANCTCQICENRITFQEMHADHVVPFSKGGLTIINNAQCLCDDCNRSKGAKVDPDGNALPDYGL